MKKKTNSESGFTLLELLISLAMIGILVTACSMTVRLAMASREAGTQKIDIYQRLRVLHEQLNSTLRSAHLIFVPNVSKSLIPDEKEEDANTSKVLAFEGKPESLRFVTYNDKLMQTQDSGWMHEVHFYLQKNEDTNSLEILLNERNFSPENFLKPGSPEQETGQTLRIAQDVAYLKFRYYYEISEKGNLSTAPDEKPVKVSGEWTDKIITEPFDFKSTIDSTKSSGESEESVRVPRAVEVSIGLWKPVLSEGDSEPEMVELPPTIFPIQTGMVFERFKVEEEDKEINNEPKE